MESSFKPLPVETIVRALAGLPSFRTSDTAALVAVRADLARAIASGQDGAQLSADLATPGPWFGVDLKKAGITPPTVPQAIKPAEATTPAWATAAARAAQLAKSVRNILLAGTPGHHIQEPAGLFLSFTPQKAIPVYGALAEKALEERLKQLGLPVNTPVSVLAVELFDGEANVIPPNRFGPEATAPGAVAVQPDL
jgi:hypothetical protein